MRERRRLDEAIAATRAIEKELADTVELMEMAEAEGDTAMVDDAVAALAELAERAERDKVAALLAGEADANDTYIEVNAGAGGTESQDWAEMLQRMYTRWGERHGMKVELIDHHAGEQAGIKSATLMIKGENAYGYAKTESGVHRLVRISPYDRTPGATPASRASGSIRWSTRISTSRSTRATCGSTPTGPRGRRPAHQHHRQRGPHHPPSHRHRRPVPEPALPAQEPRRGDEPAQGASSTRPSCRSARPRPMRPRPARPTSAGATRSAPTCSSPISW